MRGYLALVVLFAGCGSDASDGVLGGSLTVSGDVYDFQTNQVIASTATIGTSGLDPSPMTTVDGAHFTLDRVPENSSFQILAGSAPTYHATYSPAVTVLADHLDGVKAYTVAEAFLTTLATGFTVTPSAANGILILRLVDMAGNPKAGLAGSDLVLSMGGGATGPKFLDANLMPAPAATASSTSGIAIFYEVPPGVISLGQAATTTVTLAMATSPVGAATVTIADVVVTDGAPPALPSDVSFNTTVYPIFANRGCVACHSGNGPGKDLGGLTLNAGAEKVYRELTQENPLRAHTTMPETSLVLTMPSAESPPDRHPNITFASPNDPDYLKILVWLREGAKQN